MASNKKITYIRFPTTDEFLCEQCLDNDSKEASNRLLDRDCIAVVRNDCHARFCMSLMFCGCICKDRYSEQCRCHEPLREYDDLRICYCCQICRYTSAPLLNSSELVSLKVGGGYYFSCTRCRRYMYHKYDNKNGVQYSNVSLAELHRLVTQKKVCMWVSDTEKLCMWVSENIQLSVS
jgi:hypothetical protein